MPIDDMRDWRAGWINDIQESCCFAVRRRGRLYRKKLASKTLLDVTYPKRAHCEQLGQGALCEIRTVLVGEIPKHLFA